MQGKAIPVCSSATVVFIFKLIEYLDDFIIVNRDYDRWANPYMQFLHPPMPQQYYNHNFSYYVITLYPYLTWAAKEKMLLSQTLLLRKAGGMPLSYKVYVYVWNDHQHNILTLMLSVLQYKGAHVKPGFAEHFYSNPGRYKGRENMLVSLNFIAQEKPFQDLLHWSQLM